MSDAGESGRMFPIGCTIRDNYYYGNTKSDSTRFFRVSKDIMAKNTIENDRRITPDEFVDYGNLNLEFSNSSRPLPEIPFRDIGLVLDDHRRERPDPEYYRMAVRKFFDGIASMPGTTRKIDTAKLVEEGPVQSGKADIRF